MKTLEQLCTEKDEMIISMKTVTPIIWIVGDLEEAEKMCCQIAMSLGNVGTKDYNGTILVYRGMDCDDRNFVGMIKWDV